MSQFVSSTVTTSDFHSSIDYVLVRHDHMCRISQRTSGINGRGAHAKNRLPAVGQSTSLTMSPLAQRRRSTRCLIRSAHTLIHSGRLLSPSVRRRAHRLMRLSHPSRRLAAPPLHCPQPPFPPTRSPLALSAAAAALLRCLWSNKHLLEQRRSPGGRQE